MHARDAVSRLQRLGVPAVTTSAAAAVLGLPIDAASHTLRRVLLSGLVTRVRKGVWAIGHDPDPHTLAEYVTAPYPSYLSPQTALNQRGLTSQVPEAIFVVSLARSTRVRTPSAPTAYTTYSPSFSVDSRRLVPPE